MKTTFIAPDSSVAVDVEHPALWAMLDLCVSAGRLETGGILLGRYSSYGDRVAVSRIVGPPPDSKHHYFGFVRGVHGLAAKLRAAWSQGEYYVGEWHFHPHASPTPSGRDRSQILAFSQDPDYHCPHPVLIVVGGVPPTDWSASVSVVINQRVISLVADAEGSPDAGQRRAQGRSQS